MTSAPEEVRASEVVCLCAAVESGRTVCPGIDGLSFFRWVSFRSLYIAQNSAYSRRAARQLMTGAQQISSRMRAVFVSAGCIPRTEVVEMSPTRGYMGIPSFEKRDELWGVWAQL